MNQALIFSGRWTQGTDQSAISSAAAPQVETPEQRLENAVELSDIVQEALLSKSLEDWFELFAPLGVPVGKITTLEEAIQDEQLTINNIIVPPVDGDMNTPMIINHPVKVDSVPQVGPKRAPELGEHIFEIFEELGYTTAQIDDLRNSGAI